MPCELIVNALADDLPPWFVSYNREFNKWKKNVAPATSNNLVADFAAYMNLTFTNRMDGDMEYKNHVPVGTKLNIIFEFPTEADMSHFLLSMPPV